MAGNTREAVEQLNAAFARRDIDYVVDNVTDDIQWTLVGNPPIHGKANLIEALKKMESSGTSEIVVNNIITHGNMAAVEGTTTLADSSGQVTTYAFCDIYALNRFKNGKFKTINSYVIEIEV